MKPEVKAGDLIELISMGPDPYPISPGERGRVKKVTPWGQGEYQIQVEWESGRGLHLIYPVDNFKVLSSEGAI